MAENWLLTTRSWTVVADVVQVLLILSEGDRAASGRNSQNVNTVIFVPRPIRYLVRIAALELQKVFNHLVQILTRRPALVTGWFARRKTGENK